jgi:hypothetical protein
MKNHKFIELALEAGGSHYPETGGQLLEKFAELVVRECANIAVTESHDPYQSILRHYGLE